MIIFRKLRWKNILSTGNIFTEIQLDKHNSTLIVGGNGTGKSTILDALSYGLFGKPFRKINKSQLVNSITNKNLMVEIEFDISPNKYKIVRGMKPNVFEVYQNGNLLNQSAEMKDYQELVEKQILKINQKSFNQVVVLGSATFQPFMQLSVSQRREIIEDLLDLQIFTVMNGLLKDKVSKNKESIIEMESEQRLINEKIKLVKEHMQKAQIDNKHILDEKNKVIGDTRNQITKAKKQIEEIDNKILELAKKVENRFDIETKMENFKRIRMEMEHQLKDINNDVKFFEDNDHCLVCKQDITKEHADLIISQKKSQIAEMKGNAPSLLKDMNEIRDQLAEILENESKLVDCKMEVHRINACVSSWLDYIKQTQKEIESAKDKVENENSDRITVFQDELKSLEKKYNELVENKNILSVASSLLKDGGIKARIIKQYVPVINKLINKYLSAMDFFVAFELNEEFNETIKSRYRDEFSYSSFSEGEKMRINLAILFTWRAVAKLRNSINTNLLIMDEVFDSSLDSNGTEEFMRIINDLTADTNTFIISHKGDQLIDKFTNVVKFTKHKNFSKIA